MASVGCTCVVEHTWDGLRNAGKGTKLTTGLVMDLECQRSVSTFIGIRIHLNHKHCEHKSCIISANALVEFVAYGVSGMGK
jgi:hypothetical protein